MESPRTLDLLKEHQAYLRVEKGLRPLTCEAYLSDLKTFAEFLEGRNALLLTAVQDDVAGFLEHLRRHAIDSRSAARKLSCLRGFYKWLLLDRRIHHDPTVNIESPKAWKVLPKSLAETEVNEMLTRAGIAASHPQAQAAALRDRAILELLYAGGLRVSEVTALSTGDLALDAGRVHVRGKGDKERIVPLGLLRGASFGRIFVSWKAAPGAHQHGAQGGQQASGIKKRSRAAIFICARNASHAAVGLEAGEKCRQQCQPTQAAPQLRHPHGGARRRPAQRAVVAGPRRYLHHAGVYPLGARPSQGRASPASSPWRAPPGGRE